jgi:uncharacterized protein (DUF58 family)
MARLQYYYPLTVAGTALLLAGAFLLGSGVSGDDPYSVLIGFAAIAFLVILALLGRLQARKLDGRPVEWSPSPRIRAREILCTPLAQTPAGGPGLFFRTLAELRGSYRTAHGRDLPFFIAASSSSPSIELSMRFPVSGVISAGAYLSVRDVFGLTRARFGESPVGNRSERVFTVEPAPLRGIRLPPLNATGGDEEASRMKSSEEERYYMREYAPGDRFRDINWKTSQRLPELYTRVSPMTQQKSEIISVYFRHFISPQARPPVDALFHLDYLKSWMLAVLRDARREHPEYLFEIVSGAGRTRVENDTELDELSRLLAGLRLGSEPPSFASAPPAGEALVFATAYDEGLSRFLSGLPPATAVHLYRCVHPKPRAGADSESTSPSQPGPERRTVEIDVPLTTLRSTGIPLRDLRPEREFRNPPLAFAAGPAGLQEQPVKLLLVPGGQKT